jgi:hypothetical protein
MRSRWGVAVSCLLVLMACSCSRVASSTPLPAGSSADDHPVSVEQMVTRFVTATNARNLAGLNALLHPKSLACITSENKDFYDRSLVFSVRQPIFPDYHFTDKTISATDPLPAVGYATFPLRPTHEIQIEYTNGVEITGMVMFWLVNENGRWYKDDPCINADVIKQFHDDLPHIKAQEEETRALVAEMKEPLLSEIKSLIQQGKTSSAAHRYSQATGKDGSTAMFVIAEMEEQMRAK